MNKIISKIKEYITILSNKIGDKAMHAICSFIITFIIGLFNILAGVLLGCIIGLSKEIYDQFKYEKYGKGVGFDREDLVYDMLGIIIALVILILI